MDSNDLTEYARCASELGTCWARPEHILWQSECLAGQMRQSKSSLKAALLVPALIRQAQASVICDQNSFETSYRTTYFSLNMLSQLLTELCVAATTAHRVHTLGLPPFVTFYALKTITPRLCSALGELDNATKLAKTELLALERLVDHATCCVKQLLADASASRRPANRIGRWTIVGFVTRCLSYLSWSSKEKSLRAMRQRHSFVYSVLCDSDQRAGQAGSE
jgi:hypothetical protein